MVCFSIFIPFNYFSIKCNMSDSKTSFPFPSGGLPGSVVPEMCHASVQEEWSSPRAPQPLRVLLTCSSRAVVPQLILGSSAPSYGGGRCAKTCSGKKCGGINSAHGSTRGGGRMESHESERAGTACWLHRAGRESAPCSAAWSSVWRLHGSCPEL